MITIYGVEEWRGGAIFEIVKHYKKEEDAEKHCYSSNKGYEGYLERNGDETDKKNYKRLNGKKFRVTSIYVF